MATHFDQHFAEFEITQAQFRLLMAINATGASGIAPSDLAKRLHVERAAISAMTNVLVERELLVRLPGENRRTFNLAVSETGTLLLQGMTPAALSLANRVLHSLDDRQRSDLRAMLESIEDTLSEGEKIAPAKKTETQPS
jgi:DNA-binding MarR family transcriptional regulator